MLSPIANSAQHQHKFILMQPNPEVDSHLSAKTLKYLHTVGLPNSDELSLDFTGQIVLETDNGPVVRFMQWPVLKQAHGLPEMTNFCIDLQQNELIRWFGDAEQGFMNSSVEQFAQSVLAYEYYLENIQAKQVFGPFYDNNASLRNRHAYANALAEKLRAIDPVIFERGYYWPSFIEHIESGL